MWTSFQDEFDPWAEVKRGELSRKVTDEKEPLCAEMSSGVFSVLLSVFHAIFKQSADTHS